MNSGCIYEMSNYEDIKNEVSLLEIALLSH